jgi:hypothetical protein
VNEDYRDILAALVAEEARFLVGAHALAVHGYPRATVDIDIWIDPSPENAERVWRALAAFGAPLDDKDSAAGISRRRAVPHAGLVQLLESTADAAFAIDGRGIVRIWNAAATTDAAPTSTRTRTSVASMPIWATEPEPTRSSRYC